jgi:cytoskeleton protein RodZ
MPSQKPGAHAQAFSKSNQRLDLPRFRRKTGVSLEDIAQETKISLLFLRAIEAEEFEKLPGGIFTTSYLRQYAAAIGYDQVELLAHYNDCSNPHSAGAKGRPAGTQGFLDRWLKLPALARR